MKLIRLELKNFQGIKELTLEPDGQNIAVYGENGTGKTTIVNAFQWLLFDRNAEGRTDFEIKTLDKDGNVLHHGIDYSVEATLALDKGRKITLKKVYAEKWTKQRGSATKTFTGHTVHHWVDGVPVNKTEYTKTIGELVNEDIFKLLTNPLYFNTQLHWEKRRQILLEICGDITDADVIASNKELAELNDILGDKSMDGYKRIIAARRAEINRELAQIPVRISEVQHGLPDVSQIQEDKLEEDIAELRRQGKTKEQEKAQVQSGGGSAEKTKQLREVEAEIIRVTGEHRRDHDSQTSEFRNKLYAVRSARMNLESDIRAIERKQNDASSEVKTVSAKIESLRQQWHQINQRTFEFSEEDTCPTCKQMLPRAQVEAARETALSSFNQTKAKQLDSVNADGKRFRTKLEELDKQNADLAKELEQAQQTLADIRREEATLEEQVKVSEAGLAPITDNQEYNRLVNQKQQLEADIKELETSNQEAVSEIQKEIDDLNSSIAALERSIAQVEQYKRGQLRINQLAAEEKDLAKEFEKLEHELYLTEEFTRAKVRLMDQKINARFKMARFKMFKEQVNGGLADCCEVTYEGVPYATSLNNAARINVGLDIINTLSEHYGFAAPIFIDNAESVTDLIETTGQQIRLVVSKQDKKLRIESPGQTDLFRNLEKEAS